MLKPTVFERRVRVDALEGCRTLIRATDSLAFVTSPLCIRVSRDPVRTRHKTRVDSAYGKATESHGQSEAEASHHKKVH
jgi:hypothetical protein